MLNTYLLLGIVYWTVLGHGVQFGSIKRAYLTTFDDQGSNQMKDVDLNLRYVSSPDGIAVDWVARYVKLFVICVLSYFACIVQHFYSYINFGMIAELD